jgi:hypothetical protein
LFNRQSMSFERPNSHRQSVSGAPSRSDSQISRKSVPGAIEANRHPEPTIAEQQSAPKPLARSDTISGASALGFGGPSDWEHFGAGADEIDDTAMYGTKSPEDDAAANQLATIELPASPVRERERRDSNISAPDDSNWQPSPAQAPAPLNPKRPGSMVHEPTSTPPPPQGNLGHKLPPNQPGFVQGQELHMQGPVAQPQVSPAVVMDDPDYIPPMPPTPPPAGVRTRAPIVLGGSAQIQTHPPLEHSTSIVMDDGGWQPPVQPVLGSPPVPQDMQNHIVTQLAGPQIPSAFVTGGATMQPQVHDVGQRGRLGAQSPALSSHHAEALNKAQNDVRELQGKLTQVETTLAQKASELTQRETSASQAEAALKEMKEKWELQKTVSDKQEEELQKRKAEQTALQEKLAQAEAEMKAIKDAHLTEKSGLLRKVAEGEAAVATATNALESLNNQLDEEKAKATAPVDIAPGLDPWFKGSLERYKEMVQTESKPLPVKEKLQIFMDFVNAEARLRGIDLPFGPSGQVKGFTPQQPASPPRKPEQPAPIQTSHKPSISSPKDSEGFVMVDDEDVQYSPGGRPIIKPTKSTHSINTTPEKITRDMPQAVVTAPESPAKEQKATYQPFRRMTLETPLGGAVTTPPAADNATIATPPVEEKKPAYQKFVYKPGGEQAVTSPPVAQVATPPATAVPEPVYKPAAASWKPPVSTPPVPLKTRENSEPFLNMVPDQGTPQDVKHVDETMLPQPLKPKTPAPPGATAAATKSTQPLPSNLSPVEKFADLLPPIQIPDSMVSERVQKIRAVISSFPNDFAFINDQIKTWEAKAAQTRSRLDAERRKRQADTEKRSNELYDDQEIGYGDFDTLERKAKEEELDRKAKEDGEEFTSYSAEIFKPIFDNLSEQMRPLQEIFDDCAALTKSSVSGRNALALLPEETDLADSLTLLLTVYEALEARHEEIHKAVMERDRRYKRTQTKPLYARGDITRMKTVERGFEMNERKADVKARFEKAERCKRVWTLIEAAMERGIGENEDYAADVVDAAEAAASSPNTSSKPSLRESFLESCKRARAVLEDVYAHTTSLMTSFEKADVNLNECEYNVSVASARHKGDKPEYFERLQREKGVEDAKLRNEGKKRLDAVDDHLREALGRLGKVVGIVGGSGGVTPGGDTPTPGGGSDEEARKRMEKALEEARRRNGDEEW